jgi:hydrogenase maturation protein HypF
MEKPLIAMQILIRGIVQGVGFRPFVYGLAARHHLTGWVCNSSRGVEIVINGAEAEVNEFVSQVRSDAPPLSRIDSFNIQPISPNGYTKFEIRESVPQPGEFIPVSPDVSTCPDCERELFDPANRRYRYPFINCTNCGPRFTIVRDIPYDRPNTTMSAFPLCEDCRAEYENPLDRRFHAQPVACAVCGPQVWFEVQGQRLAEREDAIQAARRSLIDGQILAIKGLGGYHLACDATNPQAVAELRRRKQRIEKPFALMGWNLAAVERYCRVSEAEAALLQSRQRPIVLLKQREERRVAPDVAPGQTSLGIMLPYTPLHLLLLEPEPGFPDLLVMTSGNLSEEPIAYQDADARQRLAPLADAFLLHDRPIHMRVDDSVTRSLAGKPVFLRRSRGFAPDPLRLPFAFRPILAAGAELKNTFCLTRQEYAFVSHHIGDLENFETLQSFEEGIRHFEKLFRITPESIACDLHPDYLSTRYAQQRAAREGLPLVEVQHHHAHLAACLADNCWPGVEPAIGLIFDGTGLGTDGTIWGGEILIGGYTLFERRFHLKPLPLPGGDQAVRKPGRMALAALWQTGIDWEPELPPVRGLCEEERTILRSQLEKHINTPLTSSMGRLFDAVAAIVGVRQKVNYEGQAAMELEALADPAETGWYEFNIGKKEIDPQPVLSAVIADWMAGVPVGRISAKFHNSLVRLAGLVCEQIRAETGIRTVALAGGVWQNRYLTEHTLPVLRAQQFDVLTHQQLPANDGSISLGQAVVAGFANQS